MSKKQKNQNKAKSSPSTETSQEQSLSQNQTNQEQGQEQSQNSSRPEAKKGLAVHILVFSYSHDILYLEQCLKSIRKFATGFSGVTVVVPEKEIELFKPVVGAEFNLRSAVYPENEILWHVNHQGLKCAPDKFVPKGTDLVCHLDSDCVFTQPVTPDDYIVDQKPVSLMERYDSLKPGSNPWQIPTEEILKTNINYEFMRRHPNLYWILMLPQLRTHVENLHSMPFQEFILTRKPTFCWGISDFNLMGAYAFMTPEWKDKYHFIDLTGGKPHPESSKKLVQFWSRSPIDKSQSTPWDLNLVPIEFCKSLGL